MACKTKHGGAHSGAVEGLGFHGLWGRDAGSPVPGVCMCGGAVSSRNCLTLKMALASFETSETTRPSTRRHIRQTWILASFSYGQNGRFYNKKGKQAQAGKQAPGKPNAVNWSQFLSLLHFRYRRPSTRISGAANNSANCQLTKVWTHATYPSLCQSADPSVPMTLVVPVPWMCIPFLSSLRWNVPVRWISSNVVNCRLPHGTLPAGRNCVDRTVRAKCSEFTTHLTHMHSLPR